MSEIKVLKTSSKGAKLITDGNKVAWIMPRMTREDGSFTDGALKALKESTDTLNRYQGNEFSYIDFCEIARETDKAILVKAKVKIDEIEKIEEVEFWITKSKASIVENKLKVEESFLEMKINEISEKNRYIKMNESFSEHENSYKVNTTLYEYLSEQSVSRSIFFPKSVCFLTNDNKLVVPLWLFNKKKEDLLDSVGDNFRPATSVEIEYDVLGSHIVPCRENENNYLIEKDVEKEPTIPKTGTVEENHKLILDKPKLEYIVLSDEEIVNYNKDYVSAIEKALLKKNIEVLNTLIRHEVGLFTKKKFIEKNLIDGNKIIEENIPKYADHLTRKAYNKLSWGEQIEYDKKINSGETKIDYRIIYSNNTYIRITKTEYQYAFGLLHFAQLSNMSISDFIAKRNEYFEHEKEKKEIQEKEKKQGIEDSEAEEKRIYMNNQSEIFKRALTNSFDYFLSMDKRTNYLKNELAESENGKKTEQVLKDIQFWKKNIDEQYANLKDLYTKIRNFYELDEQGNPIKKYIYHVGDIVSVKLEYWDKEKQQDITEILKLPIEKIIFNKYDEPVYMLPIDNSKYRGNKYKAYLELEPTISKTETHTTLSNKERKSLEQTEENRAEISQLLYEFFTPQWVAEIMVNLAYYHDFNGGKVLEPSFGQGIFFDELIKKGISESDLWGFEKHKPNFDIVREKFKDAHIYNTNFEYQFVDNNNFFIKNNVEKAKNFDNTLFDLVIGNPPYGSNKSPHAYLFNKDVQVRIEGFFIYLALQKLKKGGILAFIINSLWLNNGNLYNKQKEKIAELGTLIDAYRLPNNIFKDTDIATDIVIFKRK